MDTAEDNISQCSDESLVLIRINIPDLGVQKCMQFHRDELVWDVKQQVLAALPKELKESFNYGLYCPPSNGKAGKFLDEERPLLDYPFPGPIGYLELKYKRRVYKMMNVDEKQIKQLHTKANLRRLLDFVQSGQAEKISKLCAKGLDPNFHCHETGETPLSFAAAQRKCNRTILALANGGALLDFRTKDCATALHRAVEKNNLEAIKTLLDLGASPNYKDAKGLTPLYCSVLMNADAHICELLLHDHATIGAADPQGWQEVHQACRNGLVQHLEHLLFYGADMNARNASGNTPLHVCAVNEQESCARVLLFRGADKDALNYANQTPYQVAVIAGNLALAEVIQSHSPEDVVPFREPPKYNPRRRASIASSAALNRTHSDPRLEITLGIKPPSPSPSNRSLPPFSSASSLSETSTGSSSTCTQPSNEDSEDTASVSVITEKSVTSDSSGVCGSITCNTGGYDNYPERPAPLEGPLAPGLMCVCLENYNSDLPGHLQLSQGDIIEVTGSTDCGLLEGILRHQQGLFPASCVQEVRLRHPDMRYPPRRVEGRRETSVRQQQMNSPPIEVKQHQTHQHQLQLHQQYRISEPRTVVLRKGKKGFGFVLRGAKATSPLMEMLPTDNCPALQYLDDVDKGGVADLAGLKKGDFLLTINGEDVSHSSHEHVVNLIRQSGELVAMAVMTVQRPSGVLLERPPTMAARQCSTLPRKLMRGKAAPAPPRRDPRTTLSVGRARARSMVAGLAEIEALDRTLLEYDSEGRSTKSSSIESLPNKQQQLRSDGLPPLKTTVSLHSRPCPDRLTAVELQEIFAQQQKRDEDEQSKNDPGSLLLRSPKVYGSVAQMKRSRANKHKHGGESAVGQLHKVFHSTPDLNDASLTSVVEITSGVVPPLPSDTRKTHSQEDVTVIHLNGRNIQLSWEGRSVNGDGKTSKRSRDHHLEPGVDDGPWHSIEEIYNRVPPLEVATDERKRAIKETTLEHPPPPTHPPPPPPIGQVVRVDVSRSRGSEYAKVTVAPSDTPKPSVVMSSFRPGDSAKLYASPQEIGVIGYRAPTNPPTASHVSHKPVSCATIRSRSLPPNVPPPSKTSSPSSSTSSETETSGDSSGGGGSSVYTCSTFKKPYRQAPVAPDAVSTDSGNSSERGSHSSVTVAATTVSPYAQPVVSYREHPLHQNGHLPPSTQMVEPYIPEPDYDVSDEEVGEEDGEDAVQTLPVGAEPSTLLSVSRPGHQQKISPHSSTPAQPPPRADDQQPKISHPDPALQPDVQLSQTEPAVTQPDGHDVASEPPPPSRTSDHPLCTEPPTQVDGPLPGTEQSLQVEAHHPGVEPQPFPPSKVQQSGDHRKKPPTPPLKHKNGKAVAVSGSQHSIGHVVKQIISGSENVQRSTSALPKNASPVGSPASVCKQTFPVSVVNEKSKHVVVKGDVDSKPSLEPSPTVSGKPPAIASKLPKTSTPTSATLSPVTSRSEAIALSDFKQIIAQKAAERQRRASFTMEVGVGSPAAESPKTEVVEPASVVEPLEPPRPVATATIAATEGRHTPPAQDDDIAINVKEQISAFEKKSESVKTSPSVVRAASKKPDSEPRKILKGSHSQIFEAKVLEKINGGPLKPSKSCPLDFPREDVDSSSSGVTSEVVVPPPATKEEVKMERQADPRKETEEVDKESDESDDDSDGDMNDDAWNLKAKITETDSVLREDLEVVIASRRILTKNAVSLAKLPPPIETGETDAESDITEPTPPKASGNSFDSSCNCSEPSSPDGKTSVQPPTSTAHDGSILEVRISDRSGGGGGAATTAAAGADPNLVEEKIHQSMKLIKMHASSLQEVNALAGLVPPPPGFDERPNGNGEGYDVGMIAPPPEFSDDVHVPIDSLLEDGNGTDSEDSDEAEMAAKNAAAALAAAAGGLHLSCPSFIERNAAAAAAASKLPTRSGSATAAPLQKGHQHYPPHYQHLSVGTAAPHPHPSAAAAAAPTTTTTTTTKITSRQMVRPSTTKVRLPPSATGGACNGVPSSSSFDDPPISYPHDPNVMVTAATSAKLKAAGGLPLPVATATAAHPLKEFRTKVMSQWSTRDVSDWLESLFLPEYKARFEAAGVDGRRLSYLDTNSLMELGVKRVGHRMNMERSLRRHSMMKQ